MKAAPKLMRLMPRPQPRATAAAAAALAAAVKLRADARAEPHRPTSLLRLERRRLLAEHPRSPTRIATWATR
jgi:hypothetical protein